MRVSGKNNRYHKEYGKRQSYTYGSGKCTTDSNTDLGEKRRSLFIRIRGKRDKV